MKKLVIIALLIALVGAVGCDDEKTKITTGIKVTASLTTGTYDHDGTAFTTFGDKLVETDSYTGNIDILVWPSTYTPDAGQDEGDPVVMESAAINTNGGSVTIGLEAGDYMVLALYDFKQNGEGIAGRHEYYEFYGNKCLPYGSAVADSSAYQADLVTVTAGEINEINEIVIDENSYEFGSSNAFENCMP